jgi:general secretion pathway protein G
MKKAFTMIELIFVIVILGILATVAIPKLAATRTDAEVSKLAQNIMMSCSEIASYALSNARTDDDLKVMSNAISSLENSGNATLTTKKAVVKIGNENSCVTIEVQTSSSDDNLSLSVNSSTTDSKCIALQALIDSAQYPMKLRGQYVK